MATVIDIAERLNLDKSTVSRALNHHAGRMSTATRQRILRTAKELGYVPNPAALALSRQRTGNIGLVSKKFNNALYNALLLELAIAVDEQGGNLVTCITGRDAQHHGQTRLLHTGHVDGILAFPYALPGLDSPDSPWMQRPLVLLLPDRPVEVPAVLFDDADGVRQVVRLLRELGHRRVLYLHGLGPQNEESAISLNRLECLRREWAAGGGQEVLSSAAQAVVEGGYEALQAAQKQRARFTAVLAYNDQMAQGAVARLFEQGRRIPEEVSLVGWNDVDHDGRFAIPPLTSVRTPARELAHQAIDLLNRQIDDPAAKAALAREPARIPLHLEVRRSTGPAPNVR